MSKGKNKGFTMLEFIFVIVIIGILATLALPPYTRTREHALGKEAVTSLKLIVAAEKIYRLEYDTYWPPSGSNTALSEINDNLKLSLVATSWDWSITGVGSSFTASADRKGIGPYSNCIYQIDPDDNLTTVGNCP